MITVHIREIRSLTGSKREHDALVVLPEGPRPDAVVPALNAARQCLGHPAGPYDTMGQTAFCNGTCRSHQTASIVDARTVLVRSIEPEELAERFERAFPHVRALVCDEDEEPAPGCPVVVSAAYRMAGAIGQLVASGHEGLYFFADRSGGDWMLSRDSRDAIAGCWDLAVSPTRCTAVRS